jgi:hypothetical protein
VIKINLRIAKDKPYLSGGSKPSINCGDLHAELKFRLGRVRVK